MQQFCTYGSVRGASGQRASLPRQLHAFGLLNNSFQPTDEIRIARTLWRHRGNLVAEASSTIQRMQKVLTEMNVQLSNVLSDLSGVSGMKIIGAILEGERDPWKLAALVEPEVKATPEDIAKSLEGNWREELLFVLRQQVELYRIYQEKIGDCDLQLRKHLESFGSKLDLKTQPIGPQTEGQEEQPERSLIRFAHGVISHYGHRLGTNQRHRCSDGADRDCRGRRGPKRLSQRKAVRQLVGIVPHQRAKWRQNPEPPHTKSSQSGHRGVPQRGRDPAAKPELSGSAIPPPAHPSGRSQSHHRYPSALGKTDPVTLV